MIYVLIPSFNDCENFAELFKNISKALKGQRYKVIIVNDGSTDKTKQVIKKLAKIYRVTMIGYDKNRGPGYAFKFGFNYLIPRLKTDDLIITMEADNTADYSILKRMIQESNKFDVILASPYSGTGTFLGINLQRKILGRVASILDRFIFRLKNIKTYSSFYRIYRAVTLKKAKKVYGDKFITENGFAAVIEFLIKLSKIGATFSEIPAIVDWRNREGKSKMRITKTIIRHLGLYKNYLQGKYTP